MALENWPWDLWDAAARSDCPEFWGWLAGELGRHSWWHPASVYWFQGYWAHRKVELSGHWLDLLWGLIGLGWPVGFVWWLWFLTAPLVGWVLGLSWRWQQTQNWLQSENKPTGTWMIAKLSIAFALVWLSLGALNGWFHYLKSQTWGVTIQATPVWVSPPQTNPAPYSLTTLPPGTLVRILHPTRMARSSALEPNQPVVTPKTTDTNKTHELLPSGSVLPIKALGGWEGWVLPEHVRLLDQADFNRCQKAAEG